ncbi:MAG TPA: Stp1/IreP family PP2C-type Ser/Thr phosphatase [Candidatus Dormibacteraeota bacterium]|nr:Stp1/IreP family PP2C-type Ser/Thr phosphatase [Candidatus Dormibacteraeota bacterium]
MSYIIQAAGITDIGLVRKNNEDNFGYDLRHGIFVVCDGMGGQQAGELASKIGVDTVLECYRQSRNEAPVGGPGFEGVSRRAADLAGAIQLANLAIHEAGVRDPTVAGMGSTIVAVAVDGGLFSIANVGDSRIYLIRKSDVVQLTNDHSLVMEQVRRGLMTLEEAEQSKMQNVIVRALGTDDTVEPDLADHEFSSDDVLLLCSDGLSRYVKEERMAQTVSQESLDQACADLIEAAKNGGSDDNITCLLIRAQHPSWKDRVFGRLSGQAGQKSST